MSEKIHFKSGIVCVLLILLILCVQSMMCVELSSKDSFLFAGFDNAYNDGDGSREGAILVGEIILYDNLYKPGEYVDIYLQVETTDGDPYMGYVYIRIFIGNNEVYNNTVYISEGMGNLQYYINDSAIAGTYSIKLLNENATDVLDIETFEVYVPKWTATIKTLGSYTGEEKITFHIYESILVKVHIEDQYGNPYKDNAYAHIYYKNEEIDNQSLYFWNGNDSFTIPGFNLISGGKYEIFIYILGEVVGKGYFWVFEYADIQLDRSSYAPGSKMTITLHIDLDKIKIDIIDGNKNSLGVPEHWNNYTLPENRQITLIYTLPSNLSDGMYEVIVYDVYGSRLVSKEFEVKYFTLTIVTEKEVYLPGEDIVIFFTVMSNLDGQLIKNIDFDIILTYYIDLDDGQKPKTVAISRHTDSGSGIFKVQLPREAVKLNSGTGDGDCKIGIWANDTSGKHSAYSEIFIEVGEATLSIDLDTDTYIQGEFIKCTVKALTTGRYKISPLCNVTLYYTIYKKDTKGEYTLFHEKTAIGAKTDGSGTTVFSIDLTSVFPVGEYRINVTGYLEDLVKDLEAYEFFKIGERYGDFVVDLWMDKDIYLVGETAVCHYIVGYTTGHGVKGNIQIDYILRANDNIVVDMNHIVTERPTGILRIKLPSDITGKFELHVKATNESLTTAENSVEFNVNYGLLLLNIKPQRFSNGQTIIVKYYLTRGEGAIDYYFTVYGTLYLDSDWEWYENAYIILKKHIKTNNKFGEFRFTIPKEFPLDSVKIEVIAIDSKYHMSTSTYTIKRDVGLKLEITTDKEIYHVGDTVAIYYKITTQDKTPRSIRGLTLTVWLSTKEIDREIITDKMEGTLLFDLPDNIKPGRYFISVNLYWSLDDYVYNEWAATIIEIKSSDVLSRIISPLEANQGVFNLSILVLLVVILVALILIFRKRRHTFGFPQRNIETAQIHLTEPYDETPTDAIQEKNVKKGSKVVDKEEGVYEEDGWTVVEDE